MTYEELVEREAKIAELVKDAAMFHNGDTVGMLYDRLTYTLERLYQTECMLRETLKAIQKG